MLQSIWEFKLLGSNTVGDGAIALTTLLISLVVTTLIRSVLLTRIKHWSTRTATDLDDRLLELIEQPIVRLAYLGAIYISISNLAIHAILHQAINVIGIVVATFLGVQLLSSLVEYGVRLYWVSRQVKTQHDHVALEQTLNALVPAIKVIVWAVGIIFLLDNLGFDISAVVAGLGIGGVAVALASQGILQDLFSYFSILLDSPFEIGDFIIVGDMVGTVEHIGIKTTRLRSINGEELIIANTDLTGSRIQNFKRMQRRRIVFALGITYETGLAKLQQIPEMIRTIISQVEGVTFDRSHFASYGDFSLNYETVYFVETSDYAAYMNAQQSIYLAIKSAFDQAGIEFAYPTQLLYLNAPTDTVNAVNGQNGQSRQDTHPAPRSSTVAAQS